MPRILRDRASICFRPATVSPSYLSCPKRSSCVSARMAASGLDRSCRSLRIWSGGGRPLEQGPIQIAQVMVAQVPYPLPQVRLRRGAEDLGRRPLRLGVRRPEQDPTPPHAVLAAAHLEANGDALSVEANGEEVLADHVTLVRSVE